MKRKPVYTYNPTNQKSMREYLCTKYSSWFVNDLMLKFYRRACTDEKFIRDIVFEGLDSFRCVLKSDSEVIH